MKKNITKILALLLSLALIVSLAACGKDDNPTTTEGNGETDKTEIVTDANGEAVTDESGEKVTQAVEDETKENDETAGNEDTTAKTDDKTETTTENDGKTTTEKDTSTTKDDVTITTKTPSTKKEILDYYKAVVAKVNTSKAGFTKTRSSTASKFDVPFLLKGFQGMIEGFMGMGSGNAYSVTVKKGEFGGKIKDDAKGKSQTYYYLSNVKLSESDIKDATCTKSGDEYTITITLKDGTSKAGKDVSVKNASPLDKSGVCVGDRDIDIFDHKTAEIMYNAIEGTYSNTVIDEKTNNVKIVAKVKASTGRLTGLTITFGLECNIAIKIISTTNVTAKGTTTVTYKDFKW